MYGEQNAYLVWAKSKIGENTRLYEYAHYGSTKMVKTVNEPRRGVVVKFLSKKFKVKGFVVREALIY